MISMAESRRAIHHLPEMSMQRLLNLLELLNSLQLNPGLTPPQQSLYEAAQAELEKRNK